jgi:ribosomal protein S11
MLRDYNRDIKKDKIKNYYRIKKFYFKKKSRLLRLKKKDLYRFLKRKRKYNLFFFNKFFKVFKKYVLFFSLIKNKLPLFFFKFYFLRFIYSFLFFFKKANINKKLKYILRKYTSKLLLLRKAKFRSKLKPNVRRKIRFYYDLVYTNKYKVYKLKVKMVNSNFFITLTDPNDKVIISRSTGHVAENRKKKVKLSPYLVTNMMYLVLSILRKLKIKYLNIFINTKINRHINNVVKSLQDARHTRILKIFFSKPIPHHFGTRKPKLRRL